MASWANTCAAAADRIEEFEAALEEAGRALHALGTVFVPIKTDPALCAMLDRREKQAHEALNCIRALLHTREDSGEDAA